MQTRCHYAKLRLRQRTYEPQTTVELNMIKVHDQDIMDVLKTKYGTKAAEAFGCCLPEPPNEMTIKQMIKLCNAVLKDIGSNIRIEDFAGKDDNGYYWVVQEVNIR